MPDHRRPIAGLLRGAGSKRLVTLLLTLSGILLLVAITAAYFAIAEVGKSTERVEHTLRVESAINRLAALNEQIETARRGQLLSPSNTFANILQNTQADFTAELDSIGYLTADNELQARRVSEVQSLSKERAPLLSDLILFPAGAAAAVQEEGLDQDRGVQIARRIRAIARAMIEDEAELLVVRSTDQSRSTRQFYLIGGAATVMLVTFLLASIVLVLRYNGELNRAQAQLRRSNEGLEIAVADRTAELSRANQEIQRFAYIVSHDLRSPLVNVLGFTSELDEARKIIRTFLERLFERHPALRDETVWLAVEDDLPEALRFIRSSTEKMDRLINSILELSRQGRRTLSPEQLDMNELADGVASSLHQLAESSGATVVVEPIPALTSDRLAVEQILSNLVENALKYLDPQRPGRVVVSGTTRNGLVEIAVADNGRGIAEADLERVFELFRRAGTQDRPGEGIGLANVRALAYRLGGRIELESILGEGSTFTLALPLTFSPTEVTT